MALVQVSTNEISHHLRVAAERYKDNAANMRDSKQPEFLRLAKQFDMQCEECNELANAFDAAERIGVDGDVLTVNFTPEPVTA